MNDRPATSVVERHEGVRIPVGDEEVGATRYEPVDSDGPSPALLMYVPYHQEDLITYGAYDPLNRYLAQQGYEVVVADMVGSGDSTGFIDEPFTRREGREPAAIVDWLADQPWTTGRVGMYGKSYGGITALDAAAQRPDALEAIVPIHTPYQGVRNAFTYGGLFEQLTIGMDWLTLMQALEAKPPTLPDDDGTRMAAWRERLAASRDRRPWLAQFQEPPESPYWADKNIPVENIDIPTFAIGGWRDPYTTDTLRYTDAIDATTHVLFGPWRHTMPHRGHETAIDFRRMVRDFFDHHLRDADNEVGEWPAFRFWTERDGGGTEAGVWRDSPTWPRITENPDESVALAIGPGGLTGVDEYDHGTVEQTYDFDNTVGPASANPYGIATDSPRTNADDARTITVDSDLLTDPVELTGSGRVTLPFESTVPDPTVVVRVVDVDPDGVGTLVTAGAVRGRYRHGHDDPAPLEPGTQYDLAVPLEPTSHVFESGHRIRLAIGSSLFPVWRSSPADGTFTIRSTPDHPATLAFPGGSRPSPDFENTTELGDPVTDPSPTAERVEGSSSWHTCREHVADEAQTTKAHELEVDLPHGTLTRESSFEAAARADDPASIVTHNEMHIGFESDHRTFDVVARNTFSHDHYEMYTRVDLDGERVFEETWTD